jgi:hypothetical protein
MEGSDDPNAGGSTELAILRRDGFASMGVNGAEGSLTTRPLSFSGKYLIVNIDNPKGELLVEILGEDGQPIAPFTMANCRPILADATRLEMKWEGTTDLSSLSGKTVRLRFHLTDGDLYLLGQPGPVRHQLRLRSRLMLELHAPTRPRLHVVQVASQSHCDALLLD